MTAPSSLGFVLYEAESAWAESTATFGTRLPVLGAVDVTGLKHDKIAPELLVQYRNDGNKHVIGGQGGSFKVRVRMPGHGTTTAGAVSASALETFLGLALGTAVVSNSTGLTATGGTASVPTVSAASGFPAGALTRIGALGDGDGEGQFYAIGAHGTSNLTLLNDLVGAPANGAVVYAPTLIYPDETAAALTSLRFQLGTGNQIYNCHGCYPMSFTPSGLNPGELPTVEIEIGVSRWTAASATFPTVTAVVTHQPAPVAAGSFVFQTVGTTTRQTFSIRDFALSYTLGVVPDSGPGGVGQYQTVVGAKRTPDKCSFSFVVDAGANSATPFWDAAWTTNAESYALLTLSTADGSAVGMFWPRVCIVGVKPTQMDSGGINRLRVECEAYTGGTTTSDLTLSMMRVAFA